MQGRDRARKEEWIEIVTYFAQLEKNMTAYRRNGQIDKPQKDPMRNFPYCNRMCSTEMGNRNRTPSSDLSERIADRKRTRSWLLNASTLW